MPVSEILPGVPGLRTGAAAANPGDRPHRLLRGRPGGAGVTPGGRPGESLPGRERRSRRLVGVVQLLAGDGWDMPVACVLGLRSRSEVLAAAPGGRGSGGGPS